MIWLIFYILLFYTTEYDGKLQDSSDETLELAWFSMDKLPNILPNMHRTIIAYEKFRNSDEFQII